MKNLLSFKMFPAFFRRAKVANNCEQIQTSLLCGMGVGGGADKTDARELG